MHWKCSRCSLFSFLHTKSVMCHSEEESINLGNKVSLDSIFSVVNRWRHRQLRSCSIPGMGKRFFSFPKAPDQFWSPLRGYLALFFLWKKLLVDVAGHLPSSAELKIECISAFFLSYAVITCTGTPLPH